MRIPHQTDHRFHGNRYQYSWFCQNYPDWSGHLDVTMRHEHRAGEKLFVDYTGQTVEIQVS